MSQYLISMSSNIGVLSSCKYGECIWMLIYIGTDMMCPGIQVVSDLKSTKIKKGLFFFH